MTDDDRARLPKNLLANPRLSTWLCLREPEVVEVSTGRVELGQGILTALARIAADELDVGIGRIRMLPASTDRGPDEGATTGSTSVAESGSTLRQVCAQARAVLVAAAATRLGVPAAALRVDDGIVLAEGGGAVSYWDLDAATLLDRDAEGRVPTKAATPAAADPRRLDLPDKVFGRPRFLHDLRLPGQLHGRVIRRPGHGAVLTGIDGDAGPGATVVRDGNFLGVIAEREERAVDAALALSAAARWRFADAPLPDGDDVAAWLRGTPAQTGTALDVPADPADVIERLRLSYSRPYLAHAAIGPSCGVACWHGDRVEVWSHTQGVHALRGGIAAALRLDPVDVIVRHVEGAGCYGHNGADDAAFDAVLLARAVPGRPVRVLWSRADELGWAPLGPAAVVDLDVGLGAGGDILDWRHESWSQGHSARPGVAGTPGLLAAADLEAGAGAVPAVDPPMPAGGALRNADPIYAFPGRRIVGHRSLTAAPRTSAMRSLGAFMNIFAIESTMDELAARAGVDPVDYRLRQLGDPRARAVLERAAAAAGWSSWSGGDGLGHGVGVARYKGSGAYCAVVAEIEAVAEVRIHRLVAAVDVGRVVSLDGVRNQIEGGAVQATSWTLREQVRLGPQSITSTGWESYPILRFSEVPPVTVHVLDRPDQPSVGAGEAAHGPTAAAIGNALRDALGIPVRHLPLTPANILAAIG